MLEIIKSLFGKSVDYKKLMNLGGIIVDVRTQQEFKSGHIKGSSNIPLDTIGNNLNKLGDKSQPIITCCASGMRSGTAKRILKNEGFENVYNGGNWISLNRKI